MAMQVRVFQSVLVACILTVSIAFYDGRSCSAGNAECLNLTGSTGDDDDALSKTSLLQTKVDFASLMDQEFLSASVVRTTSRHSLRPALNITMARVYSEEFDKRFQELAKREFAAPTAPWDFAVKPGDGAPMAKAQKVEAFQNENKKGIISNAAKIREEVNELPDQKQSLNMDKEQEEEDQGQTKGCYTCVKLFHALSGPFGMPLLCALKPYGWTLPWPCHECKTCEEDYVKPTPEPGTPYLPGQPGGAWTLDEVLAVKGKLWRLFSIGEGKKVYDQEIDVNNTLDGDRDLNRIAPKLMRLGFQDCVRYRDGSGGCDGCLNWEGVGDRYDESMAGKGMFAAKDSLSHNNGLMPVAQMLEDIYKKPDFPTQSTTMKESLQKTGKSRADLWALGAIMAVEYTIEVNNGVCKDPHYERRLRGKEGLGFSSVPHCHHLQGRPDCMVKLPQRLRFFSGRRDCDHDFKTVHSEVHPDAQANGKATAEYFSTQFGFNGRRTVAIMGAHTVGRMHFPNSMLRYNWVKNGDMLFNNQYYRAMVGKKDYRFVGDSCEKSGDKNGEPPINRWLARAHNDMESGGPFEFVLEKKTCPDICSTLKWKMAKGQLNECPERNKCSHIHELWRQGSEPLDKTVESRLPAEMGLWLDFNVTSHLPTGCTGLKDFNKHQIAMGDEWMWSGTNGTKGEVGCKKQSLQMPSGSKSLSEIVQEFADDQSAWLKEFVPAYEQMLANGYDPNLDFTEGPDYMTDVTCPNQDKRSPDKRFWLCFNRATLSAPFMLKSKHDGRVLQEKSDGSGKLEMWMPRAEDRPLYLRQVWTATKLGDHMINALTGQPLVVEGMAGFTWSETREHTLMTKNGQALDRGTAKQDGLLVGLFQPNSFTSQQWEMTPISPSIVEALGR